MRKFLGTISPFRSWFLGVLFFWGGAFGHSDLACGPLGLLLKGQGIGLTPCVPNFGSLGGVAFTRGPPPPTPRAQNYWLIYVSSKILACSSFSSKIWTRFGSRILLDHLKNSISKLFPRWLRFLVGFHLLTQNPAQKKFIRHFFGSEITIFILK